MYPFLDHNWHLPLPLAAHYVRDLFPFPVGAMSLSRSRSLTLLFLVLPCGALLCLAGLELGHGSHGSVLLRLP
jgi:hypothetical protein